MPPLRLNYSCILAFCDWSRYNSSTTNFVCVGAGKAYDEHAFVDLEVAGALSQDVCRAVSTPGGEQGASCVDVAAGKVALRPGFGLSSRAATLLLSAEGAAAPMATILGRRRRLAAKLLRVAVYQCPHAEACHNGSCTAGFGGPLCATCANGYGRAGLAGACHLCSIDSSDTLVVVALLLFALCIFGLAVFFFLRAGDAAQDDVNALDRETADASFAAGFVGVLSSVPFQASAKTLVSNIQILCDFEYAFGMPFPDAMRELVRLLKFLALDFFAGIDLRCGFGSYTFVSKLVLNLLTPCVLLVLVYAMGQLVSQLAGADGNPRAVVAAKMFRVASFIVFIFYPRVSQTIFQGIGCTQLDDGEWWLTVDYQIKCSADGWSPMLVPCALLTLAIPIGIPVGMLFVLMRRKAEIQTSLTPERERFGFIVGEYNVRYFYWECLELLRKVTLVGFVCFLERGSASQLVFATLWTLSFLIAAALARPVVVAWANNLKLGADFAIVLTLFITVVLKLDLRNEAISDSGYGVVLVIVNVCVPLGLLAYYCVPEMLSLTTPGEKARTRQIFELLDTDGKGIVTRDQVLQLLQCTHGIQSGEAVVTEEELDCLFASVAVAI